MARALIREPKLLILDEPTSALDHESEQIVFSLLKSLSGTMAVVLISHSAQVLGFADHVIRTDSIGGK